MDSRSDVQLIDQARTGDSQAYGVLVQRHQSLACSVAYSSCGDFGQSEDLAQEAFVVAWQQLASLREPSRFGAWLAGITRKLAANYLRNKRRKGGDLIERVASEVELGTPDEPPAEAMVSAEEGQLVWNSIEKIPETYRETLVLFYRQDQSVDEVARSLGITQDAVRQRLSRGRALLKEKVQGLVEQSLRASKPDRAFTLATLVALPALSAPAKTAGFAATAAKGASLAKTATATGLLGALLGSLLGLVGGWLGSRATIESSRSLREREHNTRGSRQIWLLSTLFVGMLFALILAGRSNWISPYLYAILLAGLILTYWVVVTLCALRMSKKAHKIFQEDQAEGSVYPHVQATLERPQREYKSRLTLLGLPLVHVASGGMDGGRFRRSTARGWIAIGDFSFGILLSCGGVAFGGIAIGGVSCGFISLAGIAAGGIALGGLALGWVASGGMAVAWDAAFGGMAIASNYAIGGLAIAKEANTEAAQQVLETDPVLATCGVIMEHSNWFLVLTVLPLLMAWRRLNNR